MGKDTLPAGQKKKVGHILDLLRKELEGNADRQTKENAQRFFKEQIRVHGVGTAIVNRLSKKYLGEIRHLDKKDIFGLCEKLFATGYMEESFVACNWSYEMHEQFEENDILTFERWIKKYVHNWATCDTFCNHTVGAFMERYPHHVKELKRWAGSKNRWMRRASAVSLIIPAKKGLFLKEAFEISSILLQDGDDLVQKGYGWLLKEESRTRQKEVFDFVVRNKAGMPRTALRYAIEKMPAELRSKAMER